MHGTRPSSQDAGVSLMEDGVSRSGVDLKLLFFRALLERYYFTPITRWIIWAGLVLPDPTE
jgi:hypothetical protein